MSGTASAESSFRSVSHVIWDFDGVLVDSETIYTVANNETLQQFGKTFTMDIKRGMMGRRLDEAVVWLLDKVGLSETVTPEQYKDGYLKKLDQLLPESGVIQPAVDLLLHFHRHSIPMAICTGSNTYEFDLKANKHSDWLDVVPLRVLAGDDPEVTKGKPDPQPYIVTKKRLCPDVEPSSVLVIEDSASGVRSALAAGMQVIWVPDRALGEPDPTLLDQATLVLESLADLDPAHFGLPARVPK